MAASVRGRHVANARALNRKIAEEARQRQHEGQQSPVKPAERGSFAEIMAAQP